MHLGWECRPPRPGGGWLQDKSSCIKQMVTDYITKMKNNIFFSDYTCFCKYVCSFVIFKNLSKTLKENKALVRNILKIHTKNSISQDSNIKIKMNMINYFKEHIKMLWKDSQYVTQKFRYVGYCPTGYIKRCIHSI